MSNPDPFPARTLALRYFHSWQSPSDWDEMRACLADDVVSEPILNVQSADALVEVCRDQGVPWREVTLERSIFTEDGASLFYQGTATGNGTKFHVAEHLTIANGLIQNIFTVIAPDGPPPTGA